jgi:hypothetical protein
VDALGAPHVGGTAASTPRHTGVLL